MLITTSDLILDSIAGLKVPNVTATIRNYSVNVTVGTLVLNKIFPSFMQGKPLLYTGPNPLNA